MEKKILNIKNILKIIISILIIFSMCKSCAKAVIDLETLETQLDTLKTKGVIQNTPKEQNSTYWTQLKNYANNSTYNITKYTIIVVSTNSSTLQGKYFIWLMSNSINQIENSSNNTGNTLYNNWSARGTGSTYQNNFGFNSNGTNYTQGSFEFNLCTFSYVYTQVPINTRSLTLNADSEYGGNYLLKSFEFLTNGEEVTINNETVNAIKTQYFVLPFSLGQLPSLSGEFYNYILNIYDNNNNLLQQYNYYQNYNENQDKDYSNKSMITISNRNVMLSSTRLNYNQVYKLSIDVYEDTNTYETYDYLYIFLPLNAIISNGVITNPGSGDFNIQENAINNEKIAEDNRNFIDNLYNKMFTISGDYINNKIEEIRLNNTISRRCRNRKSIYRIIKWR